MSSKRKFIMPTEEEDAAINRGIAQDPDTYEVSAENFKNLKPLSALGLPRVATTPKVLLSVRYDADIIEAFKELGEGWQTRMNDALREWLAEHRLA